MIKIIFVSVSCLITTFFLNSVKADETVIEKVSASANSAGRGIKKGANRIKEATCTKSDIECGVNKLKNRGVEVKDNMVDGSKKVLNKID